MTAERFAAFRRHYRGRHRPEDALWWLDHPADTGPSSAPPTQRLLLAAADRLDTDGRHDLAQALLRAAAEVLDADRRATLRALRRAHPR